jgi:hypothetical protein
MRIQCITLRAAVDVLRILLGAHLRPGDAFRLDGPCPPGMPVDFTFADTPPTRLLEQLQTISDTTMVEQHAA